MEFLDRLREHLQGVLQQPEEPEMLEPPVIEPSLARRALIRCLERLEQQGGNTQQGGGRGLSGRSIEELLQEWQKDDRIVRFTRYMAQLLRQSIGRGEPASIIEAWVELGLARQLGLPDALPSRIQTGEIQRLAEIAYEQAFFRKWPMDAAGYATALRLVRKSGRVSEVTSLGRVFLEMAGRDAVRWLLHVEAMQSTGPADPWRLSQQAADALLRDTPWIFEYYETPADCWVSWETLQRLSAMGVVSINDEETGRTVIKPAPLGWELLVEIAKAVDSPMSILARSLLADLTLSAAEAAARPDVHRPDLQAGAAAEATARQARMVAHEIRNTLVPVKTALSAVYREVLLEPPSEVLARRRESIDRGIDSLFRFVDQLVRLATLAATPPEPFDPLLVIREAVTAMEAETGQHIEQSLPPALPLVSGHRERVVLALINVLRNAAQSAPAAAPLIRLQAESIDGARAVLVTIEDNGPGVPEEMRRAIFDEGISLRPGGTGLGLALVREVFEKEMRGLVACDASPLGGARFLLRMPTTGLERP